MKLSKQTAQASWTDEAGVAIPANRITKSEKLRENKAFALAKEAAAISDKLAAFKETIRTACDEITAAVRKEANVKESKESKGNFTWFNFDRSIKIECSINEQITFDDTLIALCQEKLNEFLNRSLEGSENAQMVRELVRDAFNTSRGKLDSKKVMGLLKYETKIESVLYRDAMNFLKQSIRRPDSRTYYRVFVKNEAGEYENVNLNFSSI